MSGLQKIIMLMLGCSVQCENNETYVHKIKAMDKHVQVELMTHITKVPCFPCCPRREPRR